MRGDVGREKTKEQAGEERGGNGKNKNSKVQRNSREVEQISGAGGEESIGAPNGESDAEAAADQGEQQTFHEQLAGDAPAAGADGGSNGHLALATGSTGEEQAGDIGTGDEEDKRDGAKENQQGGAQRAGNLIAERHDVDAPVALGIRIFVLKLGGDGGHLGLRLRIGGAGFHTRDNRYKPAHVFVIAPRLGKNKR